MKKTITLTVFLVNLIYLFAEPINTETAKLVAKNFMDSERNSENRILNIVTEELNGNTSFYIVNFLEGGWVMVSSENSTIPILGYSFIDTYKVEDEKPDAFVEWINGYKEEIFNSSKTGIINNEVLMIWAKLLNKPQLSTIRTYPPGTSLLNVSGRGEVIWGQDYNNNGGCSPSYHKYCPSGNGDQCYCGRKSAGCAAVAMGQIMWYWQWPISSTNRTYNWSLMPTELNNLSETQEEDEIANLLLDCGAATNMTYWCSGSWTTTNNIEDALKNTFNYMGVKKHLRSDWEYGNAWGDLLRSEINVGRPVLYRGDKSDLSTDKHFFVCDGYSPTDPNSFHFNWGYCGNYNGFFTLNDLTPGNHDYNKNQMAIVGISPTYDEIEEVNITDVPYTIVARIKKKEEAQQTISLPAPNKNLVVLDDGELSLIAGNTVTLNPGFHATLGASVFSAKIDVNYGLEKDITVPTWPNFITPNGDGFNDELCINVENADSWEFIAMNIDTHAVVFESAGTISSNNVCVWDGTDVFCNTGYMCNLRFKNNFGRSIENTYVVVVWCGSNNVTVIDETLLLKNTENTYLTNLIEPYENIPEIEILPNPNNGIFNLISSKYPVENVLIYNALGQIIYKNTNSVLNDLQVDLVSYEKGIYLVKVEISNRIYTKKLIINK